MYGDILQLDLLWWSLWNAQKYYHYVAHKEPTQYCRSIILLKQKNKLTEKKTVFVITTGVGLGQWVLEEGSQRCRRLVMRQTSTRDVMYNMTNKINMIVCNIGKPLRLNPKSSYHKKKTFYFFNFVSICDDECSGSSLWWSLQDA